MKDMIKDIVEQICWVKSGSILNAGASVYLDLGCITRPANECVLLTGSIPNPILFMKSPSHEYDQSFA